MEMKLNTSLIRVLNTVAFLGIIVVNTLANALPINGIGTGTLSDLYPNLFVPAGLTFSIWGVIYLFLLLFIVNQFRKKAQPIVERIGFLFFLSALANIGWIFAWHYKLVALSLVIMLILLGSLIAIYLRLRTGDSTPNDKVSGSRTNLPTGRSFKWFASVPFSVYLGWITVATIANITAVLVNYNWNSFGISDQIWTVIVILAALGITLAILFIRRDAAYSLVVVWALAGIFIKRLFQATVPVYSVIYAAAIAGVLIIIAILYVLFFKKVK